MIKYEIILIGTGMARMFLADSLSYNARIDSSLRVNSFDNDLTGNSGINAVVFSGKESEYTITKQNGLTVVTDSIAGRDGVNTLRYFEMLEFTDGTAMLK